MAFPSMHDPRGGANDAQPTVKFALGWSHRLAMRDVEDPCCSYDTCCEG